MKLVLLLACTLVAMLLVLLWGTTHSSVESYETAVKTRGGTVLSRNPFIGVIPNFFSDDECDTIIARGLPLLKPSTVQEDTSIVSPVRTSSSGHFDNADSAIDVVRNRVCQLSQRPLANMEPVQFLQYTPGQKYDAHYDFFLPDTPGHKASMPKGGNRVETFFVYLNSLPEGEGGCTYFPKLDLRIQPTKGTLVVWLNMNDEGELQYDTFHQGEPPTKGTKYGLNIWTRQSAYV